MFSQRNYSWRKWGHPYMVLVSIEVGPIYNTRYERIHVLRLPSVNSKRDSLTSVRYLSIDGIDVYSSYHHPLGSIKYQYD